MTIGSTQSSSQNPKLKIGHFLSKINKIFSRKDKNKNIHTDSVELNILSEIKCQLENAKRFPNGVIIDQEIGTGTYWSLLYPEKDLSFFQIEEASDFLMISKKWDKNTRFFIDSESCNLTDSLRTIKSLLKLGFKNIVIIGSKKPSATFLEQANCDIFTDKNEPNLKLLEAIHPKN